MTTIEIIFALLTLINTIFLAWIAWRQHKINESQLSLDLYDKRLKIFQSIMSFLREIIKSGNIDQDKYIKFRLETSEYEFLFGDDIIQFIKEMRDKGIALQSKVRKLLNNYPNQIVQSEREKLAKESEELFLWFEQQYDITIEKFKKYLSFKK